MGSGSALDDYFSSKYGNLSGGPTTRKPAAVSSAVVRMWPIPSRAPVYLIFLRPRFKICAPAPFAPLRPQLDARFFRNRINF